MSFIKIVKTRSYKNIENALKVAEIKPVYGNTGLPSEVALSLTHELFDSPSEKESFWSNVINYSYRSAQRKKASKQNLPFPAYEKWILFLRILKRAKYIFGEYPTVKNWLAKPNPQLNGISPYDALGSYLGYERVNHILDKIEYTMPA